jgi:hypothetical protein
MRGLSLVLAISLAILFVGGYFNVAGAPILERIDSLLGTSVLMDLHYGVFFFVYRGEQAVKSGYSKTDRDLRDFQEKPLGFNKKSEYKKLDKASDY